MSTQTLREDVGRPMVLTVTARVLGLSILAMHDPDAAHALGFLTP